MGKKQKIKQKTVANTVNDESRFDPQADQISSFFFFLEYHLAQRRKMLLKC